jgi:hypothetical protein
MVGRRPALTTATHSGICCGGMEYALAFLSLSLSKNTFRDLWRGNDVIVACHKSDECARHTVGQRLEQRSLAVETRACMLVNLVYHPTHPACFRGGRVCGALQTPAWPDGGHVGFPP